MNEDIWCVNVYSVDRTESFKREANMILEKHIARFNKKPERQEDLKTSSQTYKTITNKLLTLAKELFEFRKLIDERAKEYVFVTRPFSTMTNDERQEFDADTRKALVYFDNLIESIDDKIKKVDSMKNTTEQVHVARVHDGLRTYLKQITTDVASIRKEHLKQLKQKKATNTEKPSDEQNFHFTEGLDALRTNPSLKLSESFGRGLNQLLEQYELVTMESENMRSRTASPVVGEYSDGWEEDDWESVEMSVETISLKTIPNSSSVHGPRKRKNINLQESEDNRDSYDRWRAEQSSGFHDQLLVQKNKVIEIHHQLGDDDDEVARLEEQINEIHNLQETFANKVLDQDRDIDLINDLAVQTTENIVDGNEWIRKAITNSAAQRVILLFCIIVLTMTLLFLDWYNP